MSFRPALVYLVGLLGLVTLSCVWVAIVGGQEADPTLTCETLPRTQYLRLYKIPPKMAHPETCVNLSFDLLDTAFGACCGIPPASP